MTRGTVVLGKIQLVVNTQACHMSSFPLVSVTAHRELDRSASLNLAMYYRSDPTKLSAPGIPHFFAL
jgi:hypothetical protein